MKTFCASVTSFIIFNALSLPIAGAGVIPDSCVVCTDETPQELIDYLTCCDDVAAEMPMPTASPVVEPPVSSAPVTAAAPVTSAPVTSAPITSASELVAAASEAETEAETAEAETAAATATATETNTDTEDSAALSASQSAQNAVPDCQLIPENPVGGVQKCINVEMLLEATSGQIDMARVQEMKSMFCCRGLTCEMFIGCFPRPRNVGHPCERGMGENCAGTRCCGYGLECVPSNRYGSSSSFGEFIAIGECAPRRRRSLRGGAEEVGDEVNDEQV